MAAGSTYTPIATYTATGSITDYTFSSIPSTYTDLVVVCSITNTSAQTMYMRVNGDTNGNYSYTVINGTGSAASSYRGTNVTAGFQLGLGLAGLSTTNPAQFNVSVLNYANTTTYKTCLSRSGLASAEVEASVSLWRSTAAITSLTIRPSGGNMQSGSTFTLYGITAA